VCSFRYFKSHSDKHLTGNSHNGNGGIGGLPNAVNSGNGGTGGIALAGGPQMEVMVVF
jgi:hypothetical protein